MNTGVNWQILFVVLAVIASIAAITHLLVTHFWMANFLFSAVLVLALAALRRSGSWNEKDFEMLSGAAVFAFCLATLVGMPFAVSRRIRKEAARGFEVIPK